MRRVGVWGTSIKKVADEAQLLAFVQIVKTREPKVHITIFSQVGNVLTEFLAKEKCEVRTIRTGNLIGVTAALAKADLLLFMGEPFYEAPIQTFGSLLLFRIARLFGSLYPNETCMIF